MNVHDQQVVRDYRQAMRIGAYDYATRIYIANPDLQTAMLKEVKDPCGDFSFSKS